MHNVIPFQSSFQMLAMPVGVKGWQFGINVSPHLPWWSMSVQTRSIGFLGDRCCVCRVRLFPKARLQLGTFVQKVIWRKIQLQGRIWAQLLRRAGMGTQDTRGNAEHFDKVEFHTNWHMFPLEMDEDYPGELFLGNTWYWLDPCWKWFGGST